MSNEIMATSNANNDYFCTIPMKSKSDKILIAKALNAATALKDAGSEPFTIIGIMTTPGNRAQSGAECTNTYLIKDDGNAYFSQSDGIAKAARFIKTVLSEDLADGIEVFVKEMPLDNGRTLKTLDFVL